MIFILKFDPHIHSVYSGDSRSTPEDILKRAEEIELNAIAISDHNTIKGSQEAIKIANKEKSDIIVIPSIEISTDKGHMIGLGVSEYIPSGLSAIETADRIRDAGGLIIVPHPFSRYRHGLFCNTDSNMIVDGVECKNARYIFGHSNKKAQKLAYERRLARIGASDSHFLKSIGDSYTEVNTKGQDDIDGILKAIRHRRCNEAGKGTSNFLIAKEVFVKKVLRRYPKREDYVKGI